MQTNTSLGGSPRYEVEDPTFSGAAFLVRVEFPASDTGQTGQLSSPALYSACGDNLTWVGPDETVVGSGSSADVTLDDYGNAFAVVYRTTRSQGWDQLTGTLQTPPNTEVTDSVEVLSPRVIRR